MAFISKSEINRKFSSSIPDKGLIELRNRGEYVDVTLKFQGGGTFRATLENIRNSCVFVKIAIFDTGSKK